jgi:hypothetical protein
VHRRGRLPSSLLRASPAPRWLSSGCVRRHTPTICSAQLVSRSWNGAAIAAFIRARWSSFTWRRSSRRWTVMPSTRPVARQRRSGFHRISPGRTVRRACRTVATWSTLTKRRGAMMRSVAMDGRVPRVSASVGGARLRRPVW